MKVLQGLEPAAVFGFFEDICNIPHGSYNLDGISEYLENFAINFSGFALPLEAFSTI